MSVAKYDSYSDFRLLLSQYSDAEEAMLKDDVAAAMARIGQNILSIEPNSFKDIPLLFRARIICDLQASQLQKEMNKKEASAKEAAQTENPIMKFLKGDPALARCLWQNQNRIADETIYQVSKDGTELIFTNGLLSPDEVKKCISSINAQTKAKITSIKLSECDIPDLEILKDFPNLLKLDISSNPSIESLKGIESCREIREIRMSESGIRRLHELEHSAKLEHLDASGSISLKYIGALCFRSTTLKYLNLNYCPLIEDFTAIKSLIALEKLEMRNLRVLTTLDFVKNLANLTHLYVDSSGVKDISATFGLKKLQQFSYLHTPAYAQKLKSQPNSAAAKTPS